MNREEFATPDVWLAAALAVFLKTEPIPRNDNGKIIFCFPRSEKLYKAIADFNSGANANVYDYAQVCKRLKAEALSNKGQRRMFG